MSSAVLTEARVIESANRRAADEAYRAMIDQLAAGDVISGADIVAIASAANRDTDAVEKDVAAKQHRLELDAIRQSIPALRAELAAHEAIQEAASDRIAQAHSENQPTIDAERDIILALERKLANAQDAEPELIRTNNDPELRAELGKYSTERRKLATEERLIKDRLRPSEGRRSYSAANERRLAEILARLQEIDAAEQALNAELAKA